MKKCGRMLCGKLYFKLLNKKRIILTQILSVGKVYTILNE